MTTIISAFGAKAARARRAQAIEAVLELQSASEPPGRGALAR